MNKLKTIAVLALIISTSFCSQTSEEQLKSEVVTADNQSVLLERAESELTFEEVELLRSFLQRAEAQTGEQRLPAGKSIGEIIESERVLSALDEPREATATEPGETPEVSTPADSQVSGERQSSSRSSSPAGTTLGFGEPSEEEVVEPPSETAPAPVAQEASEKLVAVPSGTPVRVRLTHALSSKTSQPGDTFEAQLEDDLIIGGDLLAAEGSRVVGRVSDVKASGKVKGKAQMALTLSSIDVEGESYSFDSNTLSFEAQGTEKRDAKRIGIATGVGAVIGAIAGGGKGAAIGTAIGAGTGTGVTLATAGDEVEFATEQLFEFKLQDEVDMKVIGG